MDTGIVFNIQRYSIHDGPGIRTTVFLKGCPLRCFWCQNPESQKMEPQILFDEKKCTSCGECLKVCPSGATSRSDGRIRVDRGRCKASGKCAEVCPNEARKVAGRSMTVDEVMREVMRDVKFYENSGGGVTLSGGDPLAQPDFALSILQRCKRAGLHTALDTCGYAPWTTLEKVLPYVDLFLFDIKHPDPAAHRQGTGRDLDLILQNAKEISKRGKMRVRVPLIPGFNDSPEVVRQIARFVREELHIADVDLLTYNPLGEGKYELLGMLCSPRPYIEEARFEELKAAVRSELS